MRIRKAFSNSSLANIKFSKTRLSKMMQLRGSLASLDSLASNHLKKN